MPRHSRAPDGSSLLLDEIGDIPVSTQTKLLRVLQEQEVKPLGAARTHRVDVRIMASTNQDLERKIRELQNYVRRAVVFCPHSLIQPGHLDFEREAAPRPGAAEDGGPPGGIEPYKVAKERVVNRFTARYVSDLLEKTSGNITRAAEVSSLTRVALQKIRRRLSAPKFPPDDASPSR